jgi:hypothetical protein
MSTSLLACHKLASERYRKLDSYHMSIHHKPSHTHMNTEHGYHFYQFAYCLKQSKAPLIPGDICNNMCSTFEDVIPTMASDLQRNSGYKQCLGALP